MDGLRYGEQMDWKVSGLMKQMKYEWRRDGIDWDMTKDTDRYTCVVYLINHPLFSVL